MKTKENKRKVMKLNEYKTKEKERKKKDKQMSGNRWTIIKCLSICNTNLKCIMWHTINHGDENISHRIIKKK